MVRDDCSRSQFVILNVMPASYENKYRLNYEYTRSEHGEVLYSSDVG